jgi:hypothetical protein
MKKLVITLCVALPIGLLSSCSSCPFCSDGDASAEVVVCGDCGVEKGAEGCCDPDAERCGDCGKIKGSEACCK